MRTGDGSSRRRGAFPDEGVRGVAGEGKNPAGLKPSGSSDCRLLRRATAPGSFSRCRSPPPRSASAAPLAPRLAAEHSPERYNPASADRRAAQGLVT